ncbi:MAG: alanine racemase [Bacteroidales bacterium]|nr:alanine racemase [Bacteroidales bacterium]
MLKTHKISSPKLVISTEIAKQNIDKMMSKLPETCTFRPHFKTHINKITAKLFKEFGIKKITVSSVEMALYFRQLGFREITIAFPVNPREQRSLNKLGSNTTLALCFSNLKSAQIFSKFKGVKANAWIEIDTGYNRSGILWNDLKQIEECIQTITKSENLSFTGFLTHNGETYSLNKESDILDSSQKSIDKMKQLKLHFKSFNPLISIGDTPGCSLLKDFTDIDEIRPGNFVYYDLIMLEKQVCTIEQIAATVLCPIVDIHTERNEIVIHGGAVHFSKEFIIINNQNIYGRLIKHHGNEVSEIKEDIISLSQEHGIIKIKNSEISNYNIGDLVEIIPVHSCLTANLMKNKTLHY